MTTDADLLSLHRYFISANSMRHRFDEMLKAHTGPEPWDPQSKYGLEANILMSYWYAGLYVVVEGWQELQLADPAVDQLLTSPNVQLLKRYRHGVCHFQRQYHDPRFMDFISAEDTASWVRSLNREMGRYFLEWLRRQKKPEAAGTSE